jgi:hypothetical protein
MRAQFIPASADHPDKTDSLEQCVQEAQNDYEICLDWETDPMNVLKTVTAAATLMLVAGAAHVTFGAELQESCLQPPATVIEMTGINSSHARARAKYTEPDIIKACHEGYVHQRGWSPEECIRQTKLDLRGSRDQGRSKLRSGHAQTGRLGTPCCSTCPFMGTAQPAVSLPCRLSKCFALNIEEIENPL